MKSKKRFDVCQHVVLPALLLGMMIAVSAVALPVFAEPTTVRPVLGKVGMGPLEIRQPHQVVPTRPIPQASPFGVYDLQSGHGHGQWRSKPENLLR